MTRSLAFGAFCDRNALTLDEIDLPTAAIRLNHTDADDEPKDVHKPASGAPEAYCSAVRWQARVSQPPSAEASMKSPAAVP